MDLWPELIIAVVLGVIALLRDQAASYYKRRAERVERRLATEWIDLFRSAYRIWSSIEGLKVDLEEALARRGVDHSVAERTEAYFAKGSLYFHSLVSREVHRFIDEQGGLWLLSEEPEDNRLIADSAVMACRVGPFDEFEESQLRVLLRASDNESFPFLSEVNASESGRQLLARWHEWIRGCNCPAQGPPHEGCEVHQVLGHCRAYQAAVDEQLDAIAAWTRGRRTPYGRSIPGMRRARNGGVAS